MKRLRHIPVIMISALSELDSVVRCIEMGAEDYLPKPFNPTLLKARIGACLEKKRARDRETHLFEQLQGNYRRLQELEKLRDDLTHMIIHDLRTPLNAMFLGMQALEAMGEFNEAQHKMLGMAMGSGKTLVGIINDLLDISKMESGSLQLERRELMAADLVEAAVKQVAPLANARNLTLTTELEAGLPHLMADEAKLLRTLVNLLSNAIKFTPPGGTVTVSVRQSNEEPSLQFCVADTGEGIPSEAFARIFEKFGQVESRQGGRSMSTGLGPGFLQAGCGDAWRPHRGRKRTGRRQHILLHHSTAITPGCRAGAISGYPVTRTLLREGWFGFLLVGIGLVHAAINSRDFSTGGFIILTVASLLKRDQVLNFGIFMSLSSLGIWVRYCILSPVAPPASEYLVSLSLIMISAAIVVYRVRRLSRAPAPLPHGR